MSFTNTATALENMVIARDVLAKRGVPLFLNFGTLLGAIREHDFIAHDHDVDTGIYRKDEDKLKDALPELIERGFILFEVWSDRRCYSLQRGGEQIDIFVAYERSTVFGRTWNLDGKVSIPVAHLDSLDELDFLGSTFYIPHDPVGLVAYLYGPTWNIPIDGKASRIDLRSRIRAAAKSPLKTLAYLPTFVAHRIAWAASARKAIRGRRPGA
ncbi:MAG: LicD family protein [Treponema sp.]|nr:LicD family protein [Treponema sp.]